MFACSPGGCQAPPDVFGLDPCQFDDLARELLDGSDGTEWAMHLPASPPPLLDAFSPLAADAAQAFSFGGEAAAPEGEPGVVPQQPYKPQVDAAVPLSLQAGDVLAPPCSGAAPEALRTSSAESAPETRGSGGAVSGAAGVSQPADKAKEKNRAAQQQYRARQRKRQADSEERIELLTRELEELKTKQAALLSREAIYERFLASQRLALPQQAEPLDCNAGGLDRLAVHALRSGSLGSDGDGSEDDAMPGEWCSPAFAKAVFGKSDVRKVRGELFTFTAGGGPPVMLSREQVTRLSLEDFGSMWQDLVNELAAALLQARDDPSSPAGQRLLELCSESRALRLSMNVLRPDKVAEYAKQVVKKHGPPPAGLWRSIAGSLTLTADQRDAVAQLRATAFANVGAQLRRRSEVATSLTAFDGGVAEGADSQQAGSDYLASISAAAQTREMLQEETEFQTHVCLVLYGNIFTALQTAHCHVLAYPYELNVLAILDAIVTGSESAAPPALDLIRRGVAGSALARAPPRLEAVEPVC